MPISLRFDALDMEERYWITTHKLPSIHVLYLSVLWKGRLARSCQCHNWWLYNHIWKEDLENLYEIIDYSCIILGNSYLGNNNLVFLLNICH